MHCSNYDKRAIVAIIDSPAAIVFTTAYNNGKVLDINFRTFTLRTIIIFITYLFQKGIEVIEKKTKILPRKENEILNSDEDAVVATLVATIEFHKETGKDAKVISIKRIED